MCVAVAPSAVRGGDAQWAVGSDGRAAEHEDADMEAGSMCTDRRQEGAGCRCLAKCMRCREEVDGANGGWCEGNGGCAGATVDGANGVRFEEYDGGTETHVAARGGLQGMEVAK